MVVDPMSVNYNLTKLVSINAIDNTADVVSWWNNIFGGSGIFILLGVVGLVLFLASRKFVDSDTEALSYAGLIVTLAGIFLFMVQTSDGSKLLGWGYLMIIVLITGIATYLNFTNRGI